MLLLPNGMCVRYLPLENGVSEYGQFSSVSPRSRLSQSCACGRTWVDGCVYIESHDLIYTNNACVFLCNQVIITLSVVLGMGFKIINTNVVAFKYDGNAMALKEDVSGSEGVDRQHGRMAAF